MKKIIINVGKVGLINIFTNFYLIHTPLEITYDIFTGFITKSLCSEHSSSLQSTPGSECCHWDGAPRSPGLHHSETLLAHCSAASPKAASAEEPFSSLFSVLCDSCSFKMMFRISSLFVFILGGGNQFTKFIGSSKFSIGF